MVKFDQIARTLRAEILAGRHGEPGERFLTVRQLAERFAVSLTTAQKATGLLKDERLLVADATSPAKIGPAATSSPPATGKQGTSPRRLGLIVTDITNPFFARICRDVQQAAANAGYQVLITSSQSDFRRERTVIEGFLEIGVEGLLICPGLDDACAAFYRSLIGQGVRLAFVSRRPEHVESDFVVAHNFAGGALVAGHLLSKHYEPFGYIGFGPRLKRDERLQGFRSALFEEGVDLCPDRIADSNGRDIMHGYRAMNRLMTRGKGPRAVFAFNDLLAIGALQYCGQHGISVPHDVAIAGFDNLPESRVTSPPLTTVAYPVQSIARLAVQNLVDHLVDQLDGPAPRVPNHIFLEPRLVVRQSTDPEAAESPLSTSQESESSDRYQEANDQSDKGK